MWRAGANRSHRLLSCPNRGPGSGFLQTLLAKPVKSGRHELDTAPSESAMPAAVISRGAPLHQMPAGRRLPFPGRRCHSPFGPFLVRHVSCQQPRRIASWSNVQWPRRCGPSADSAGCAGSALLGRGLRLPDAERAWHRLAACGSQAARGIPPRLGDFGRFWRPAGQGPTGHAGLPRVLQGEFFFVGRFFFIHQGF